jgi:hypothetical protein
MPLFRSILQAVRGRARRRPASLGLLALALVGTGCAATAPPPVRAIAAAPVDFRDSVCLAVKFDQGQPMSDLPMVDDLGLGWVREAALWHQIEPEAGRYVEFSQAFKRRLAHYRERDIGIIFPLVYGNSKAYPPTPDDPNRAYDPEAMGRYAVQISRMLRREGVRFVLQVYNEPHNFGLQKQFGGTGTGKPPSPWVQQYARMTQAVVRQVKAEDPAIKVLTNEDMWVLHYWFLEAGLPPALDGFSIHPYAKNVAGPEITTPGADSDWTKPFSVVDRGSAFSSAVRRLQEQGEKKLGKRPEIWATEWGWRVGTPMKRGAVDEDQIAAYLPRTFIVAAAAQVRATCWFSAQDRQDGPMGLLTNDGRKRQAYQAFKVMSEQLGPAKLVSQVLGRERPTTGPQAFLFQGPDGAKLVLWDVEGESRVLPLRGPLVGARAVGLKGTAVPADKGPDGDQQLRFDGAPIYLTLANPNTNPDALAQGLKDLSR